MDKGSEERAKNFVRMSFPKGQELPPEFFKQLEFDVGAEHLTGVRIAKDLAKPSDFVYFHGAATGNWSRVMAFAKPIVERGSSIVAFDHSGHGTSTGLEKNSSLLKRCGEAAAIVDAYCDGKPATVCGSSMGGYVAIKMLERYDVQNLVLLCPGIYDRRAYQIPFDSGFTDILRTPESWKNSDVPEILKKFTGRLLVVIGSEDTVIPQGVIDLIDKSSQSTKKKEILVVPGAPHAIQAWMIANPAKAAEISKKIAELGAI